MHTAHDGQFAVFKLRIENDIIIFTFSSHFIIALHCFFFGFFLFCQNVLNWQFWIGWKIIKMDFKIRAANRPSCSTVIYNRIFVITSSIHYLLIRLRRHKRISSTSTQRQLPHLPTIEVTTKYQIYLPIIGVFKWPWSSPFSRSTYVSRRWRRKIPLFRRFWTIDVLSKRAHSTPSRTSSSIASCCFLEAVLRMQQ